MRLFKRVFVRRARTLSVVALFSGVLFFTLFGVAAADEAVKARVGERVFNAKCALCHGVRAVGTDKGPALAHKVYRPKHHGDFSFNLAVVRGVRAHHWKFGNMEPVKGVGRDEIEAIIVYVRALQREAGIY